jgi:hypothetical protein
VGSGLVRVGCVMASAGFPSLPWIQPSPAPAKTHRAKHLSLPSTVTAAVRRVGGRVQSSPARFPRLQAHPAHPALFVVTSGAPDAQTFSPSPSPPRRWVCLPRSFAAHLPCGFKMKEASSDIVRPASSTRLVHLRVMAASYQRISRPPLRRQIKVCRQISIDRRAVARFFDRSRILGTFGHVV